MRFIDMTVLNDLIQPDMAPFDPPSRKPHPKTKHEGDRLPRCSIWSFEIFQAVLMGLEVSRS